MSTALLNQPDVLDLFDPTEPQRPEFDLASDEIIIDCFAGGGGASLGIKWATGRSPDEAINHSATAIAIHEANHPTTRHHHSDIWEVDPVEVAAGRPVGLLWLSPDCTHFSKAKGGKPVSRKIRILAQVAVRYAHAVRPRVICLENVEEFLGWGPVSRKTNRPDPVRKGQSFRSFCRQLRREGYVVEWRMLRGCDFGAPTIRKRLFLVARCDGQPIRWPVPTHGKGRSEPWRTAAECIDWSIPCPSIFLTKEEGRALGVKRPLAEKTLRRIARGVQRYVIESAEPFIVHIAHGDVSPGGVKRWGKSDHDLREPLPTVAGSPDFALVAPSLVQTGYGEREGQAPRSLDIQQPLGTVVGCGQKHALVAAFLAKHYGGVVGSAMRDPVATVTSTDHNALVATTLVNMRGTDDCQLVGRSIDEPLPTISGGGIHAAEVRAFLTTYYGNEKDGGSLRDPIRTVTANDRFALVTVHGVQYAIGDIGMRMLAPRELARAQGFPDSYALEIIFRGKPLSKAAQVEMVGNSVNPHVAAALVRANLGAPVARERAA